MWQELHRKLMSITGTVPINSFDYNNRPAKPPWCKLNEIKSTNNDITSSLIYTNINSKAKISC